MRHLLNACSKIYGAIVALSGDVVNSIFHITLIIFFEGFPRDLFDGLDLITASII